MIALSYLKSHQCCVAGFICPTNAGLTTISSCKRTDANMSNSLTVQAHEVEQVLSTPLLGTNSVTLNTTNTWANWHQLVHVDHDAQQKYEQKCKEELPPILQALDSATVISKTTIPLMDVIALPIENLQATTPGASWLRSHRSPITIFAAIGLACRCVDVGLWSLDDFPSIEISDQLTREALLKAREFSADKGGGEDEEWFTFLASSNDPALKAFDYTADFHSRDLSMSPKWEGNNAWIDLGPRGQGYAGIMDVDIDHFGILFALDLAKNVEYFKMNEWRPHLYNEFESAGGGVSSNLDQVGKHNIIRPGTVEAVWGVSEEDRDELLTTLEVADDEELCFVEGGARKKKKVQEE